MARIDAHHHVWDLEVRDEPWITGPAMQPIRRNFSLSDLAPLAAAADVEATVLVQTVSDLDETRDFLALADRSALVAAVTGWADLTAPDVADTLAELGEGTGGRHLRAIRHQVHDEPDPAWLRRDDVRRGLHAVFDAGLAYELLTFVEHLPVARETVEAFPERPFVLDHCSKPAIADGSREPWETELRALAQHPNVTCKLSGLTTEASWTSWSVDDLRPYVETVLDAFGPDRVLFGSDWPVCQLATTYADWVTAVEALTAGLSATEREAVFAGTARRVYSLHA